MEENQTFIDELARELCIYLFHHMDDEPAVTE